MRGRGLVFWGLLASCSRAPIDLPAQVDARSVVLLLEREAGSTVEAHDLGAASRRVSVDGADELRALFYAETLEELGFVEGLVAPYSGEDGRRLPPPASNYLRDSGGAWAPGVLEDSDLYRVFRLAPEGLKLCATNGGCYPNAVGAECVRPCDEPRTPFPPMIPEVILPELGACPAGWTAELRSGITVCEPRSLDRCAPGLYPFLGGGCELIAPACDLSSWPVVDEMREVIWVRAGAVGSGASRADPRGSLAGALAASSAEAIIAVAPGRYQESIVLQGGRSLVGACPAGVVIDGTVSIGTGVLRDLSVEGGVVVTARAELSRVLVAGATALWVAPGAELLSSRTVVLGSDRAVVLREQARAVLQENVLSAPIALAMTTATATVAGTFVDGAAQVSAGAFFPRESELFSLTASASANVSGAGLVIRGGEPTVESDASWVTLKRTRVETTQEGFNLDGGSRTELEDVFLAGVPLFVGVKSDRGFVIARRMLVENTGRAFAVESTNLLVSASTIRGGIYGVTCGDDAEVRVESTLIEGTADYAFRISGTVNRPGDTYQLADLRLENNNGGILMVRTQVGRVERVVIKNSARPAMELGRLPDIAPVMFAEDLVIEDAPSAVLLNVGSINLDGFIFRRLSETAVRLEVPAESRLTTGAIEEVPVAFQVLGTRRDPRSLLTNVVLREVGEICDPCGE